MDVFTTTIVGPIVAQMGGRPSGEQLAMIMAIAGLAGLMLILTRRRLQQRRHSPVVYAREQVTRLREEKDLVHDVESVMLQLERVSREVDARMDTKLAKLEGLLRAADQRIIELQQAVESTQKGRALSVVVDDKGASAPPVNTPPLKDAPIRTVDQKTPAAQTKQSQVYRLADADLPLDRIAEQTGLPIGEIELILSLRRTAGMPISAVV